MKLFKKILIANRGDVALRILRACKELNIKTVIAHSTADVSSMPVRLADETVCIGPPESKKSYLNMPSLVSAALITGCEAIHPGVGFLAENADFAKIVKAHGLTFIGPEPEHIEKMGDKVQAKITAKEAGLPLVPGSDGSVETLNEAMLISKKIGFPILIKASAGGGGKGMKVAKNLNELENAFLTAKSEAKSAFGNDTIYIEKYLENPRHIEIQIISDSFNNVIHLGERECSVQRRHQKIFEEAPSPALTEKQRQFIGKIASDATKKMGYLGLGTMEFLFENDKFYFIEMNTRLQVEHPITEAITGIDLVIEQIKIASGNKLSFKQDDIKFKGHAIECRINAEHPETFAPSPGLVEFYHPPGGSGIRIDTILYSGYSIPPYYDSLIAKLIVFGNDRKNALKRLKIALDEFVISPIPTSLELHKKLLDQNAIQNGEYDIKWLEENFLN